MQIFSFTHRRGGEDHKCKLLKATSERNDPARAISHTLVRVIEEPSVHVYFSAPRIRSSLVLISLSDTSREIAVGRRYTVTYFSSIVYPTPFHVFLHI